MQTSDISAASQSNTSPASSQEATASSDSDFNTFLTLLTAQMRNQDPMKPMDSTEFVAQLASFSAVEQQIETNNKLSELLGMFTDGPTASLTEWLGKEVRREGSTSFDGQPVEVGVSVHPSADTARLVVRDTNAEIIYALQIDPSVETVSWDGTTQNSGTAPAGRYSFEVESYVDGDLLAGKSGSVFDLVTEVRLDHGNPLLIFEDGATLQAETATAIRMPQI